MAGRHYPLISREIWLTLLILVILASLASAVYNDFVALPFWLLTVLLAFLFRDPDRVVPAQPLAVVSPVDARVISVEQVNNPFFPGESIRIVLKMSCWGIFRVRSPMEGKMQNRWLLVPGDTFPESTGQIKDTQISGWIRSDEGDNIVLSMYKSAKILYPRYSVQTGERTGQGQRCGINPFGSIVELFIPTGSKIMVKVDDVVKSGNHVLALLRHGEKSQQRP